MSDPKQYPALSLYMGKEQQPLIDRYVAVAAKNRLSVAKLVMVCMEACIDTLEKEVPVKREFTLNGRKVIP